MTLPAQMTPVFDSDAARFRRFVAPGPNGCLVWTGSKTRQGYGRFRLRDRILKAHRVAYSIAHGTCPDGLILLHRCDTPGCVNVEHLVPGTVAENNADRQAKGRSVLPRVRRGSEHPGARVVTFQGERAALADHAARHGLRPKTVYTRLARGWPMRRALLTPAKRAA